MTAPRTPSEIPTLWKEKHLIWSAAMSATHRIGDGQRAGEVSSRRGNAAIRELWEISRRVDDGELDMPNAALELLRVELRLKIAEHTAQTRRKARNA